MAATSDGGELADASCLPPIKPQIVSCAHPPLTLKIMFSIFSLGYGRVIASIFPAHS